ncbi:MAG: hypothetical protein ACK5F0_08975 [Flavobacteriales bacterium]|jgi:hypothetical protein
MTLSEFISTFDHEGSIVLLEGKRKVASQDAPKLEALGKLLAEHTKYLKFRSGNADGSDALFTAGVAQVNPERIELILPYTSHRQQHAKSYQRHSLDEIELANEPALIYETKKNKKMARLVDRYANGDRDQYAMKAAYILRDTVKVIGTTEIRAIRIGIFYEDLKNPGQGGTGHTINVCKAHGIPVIDQNTWIHWLEPLDKKK